MCGKYSIRKHQAFKIQVENIHDKKEKYPVYNEKNLIQASVEELVLEKFAVDKMKYNI